MCLNCHVVSVNIELKNLEAIRRACEVLGWQFRENQKTYEWVGRWYDDSPVPRNAFAADTEGEIEYHRVMNLTSTLRRTYMTNLLGQCDHAIRPDIASKGEIGLIQRGDTYVPIWDYFTSDSVNKIRAENGMNGFLQEYAIQCATLEAKAQGSYTTQYIHEDGTVELHIPIVEY